MGLSLKAIHSTLGERLDDLSIPKKFLLIFTTFSLIILILLTVSFFGMSILSDVRAYVGGEGLWSKAQKDAVYYLTRYLIYEEEKDYQSYLNYIKAPLGDRKARLELEKPKPDYTIVHEGFVEGKNHPDDVAGMARLFRRYAFNTYIAEAITLWGEGDQLFSKLIEVGDEIGREVKGKTITPEKRGNYLLKINEINEQLTPIEDRFSFTLGMGARWLKNTLLTTMVVVTLVLVFLGLSLAARISRHLITEIHALQVAAGRIAKGDFTQKIEAASKDEIGDLASNFNEMKNQLLETERLKNNFFSTVSHELRTPLTLVLSPLESMIAKNEDLKESRPLLKTMHNNAVRLLQLVNGLLDFSKLEAGRMEVKREPMDLVAMTKSIVADFGPIVLQKKLSVQADFNKEKIPVLIDRYLYERILFNLLSNAIKFTETDGAVAVSLKQDADILSLTVKDSGIGIPEAEQKNLFQKFRQVEGSSTRRYEGSGLGLALVKEFAALLGGSVAVESRPGKGSLFTVRFIAPALAGETATPLASLKTQALVQKYNIEPHVINDNSNLSKVLIAEDNTEMAAYIAELLRPLCQTRIAGDGEEALAQTKEWQPDLVLSDIMMPKKDGLSLCKDIKASPQTAAVPVILLTALTHREALLKGWEAGADDYLFKPFHPVELITRVRTLLSFTQERTRRNAELEEKIEERTKALKVVMEDLQQFAFIASHDLREPIRKIRAFGDLLRQEGGDLNEVGRTYLDRMQDASKRMELLIGSLRTYSMIDRQEEPFALVDLNGVVSDVLSDLEIRINETGAKVQVDTLPRIWGSQVQMGQLFQNLLSNAIKFHGKGKSPDIKVRARTVDKNKVEVFVEDNGIGFEARFAEHIFKPFQRLHARTTYEGIGMGLAICQRIVLKHGGTIVAQGRPGEGSTFLLTLPLTESQTKKKMLEGVR